MTKAKTAKVIRYFDKDDPIEGASGGKSILTRAEYHGRVGIELTQPVAMPGKRPDVHVLIVKGPTKRAMKTYARHHNGTAEARARAERRFYGSCCVNLPSNKVKTLHAIDYKRLERLLSHYFVLIQPKIEDALRSHQRRG